MRTATKRIVTAVGGVTIVAGVSLGVTASPALAATSSERVVLTTATKPLSVIFTEDPIGDIGGGIGACLSGGFYGAIGGAVGGGAGGAAVGGGAGCVVGLAKETFTPIEVH